MPRINIDLSLTPGQKISRSGTSIITQKDTMVSFFRALRRLCCAPSMVPSAASFSIIRCQSLHSSPIKGSHPHPLSFTSLSSSLHPFPTRHHTCSVNASIAPKALYVQVRSDRHSPLGHGCGPLPHRHSQKRKGLPTDSPYSLEWVLNCICCLSFLSALSDRTLF